MREHFGETQRERKKVQSMPGVHLNNSENYMEMVNV